MLSGVEDAPRRQEERASRFHTGSDLALIGMAVFDGEGRYLFGNARFAELLGHNEGDMRSMHCAELIHPDDLSHGTTLFHELIAGQRSAYEVERQDRRSQGHEIWIRIAVSRAPEKDDTDAFLIAMVEDISRRKTAEKALQESEERYRTIFNASPIGISLADLTGRFISSNDAYHRMLGYSEEELHGLTFRDITHPDDLQADLDLFHEVMTGQRAGYQMTKRYIRKDGQIVWVHLTVVVLRDPDGTPTFDFAMVEDITERRAYEEQLRHHALYDTLTDLPNRTLLFDRLQRAILSTHRDVRSTALLLLDLDHFKYVNDTFGHPQGDVLLQQVAGRLAAGVRASDTVARLHGDEFALVLPSTDDQGAVRVARKLQRLLETNFQVDGESLRLEVSMGIAVAPVHGDDPGPLLRRADIALHAAKRDGSGYALYTAEQEGYSARRLRLIAELRDAIDNDRLALYFQPRVEVRTGLVTHAEVLVRWPHPSRGLVPPSEFLPLAEETGLINALSKRVLTMARDHYEHWRSLDLPISIAINLSARNLRDRGVQAAIETMFRRSHLPPGAVAFEITETGFLEHSEETLVVLERFHELGARIVIDDFGTGYSSLAYLARLPVDEIKIDRSFVADMRNNETHRVIVRSTIDLAHNLGLVATAEGVEDRASLDLLAEMECDMVQGYYISRPLPGEAFLKWMTTYESEFYKQHR